MSVFRTSLTQEQVAQLIEYIKNLGVNPPAGAATSDAGMTRAQAPETKHAKNGVNK